MNLTFAEGWRRTLYDMVSAACWVVSAFVAVSCMGRLANRNPFASGYRLHCRARPAMSAADGSGSMSTKELYALIDQKLRQARQPDKSPMGQRTARSLANRWMEVRAHAALRPPCFPRPAC